MELEELLKRETLKWLSRLDKIKITGDREFVENIKAYISDSRHFLSKNDLVRAFEAVVWAWAWYEIGKDVGKISSEEQEGEDGEVDGKDNSK